MIRTVLGDIGADEAGHVQPHEHVLCDMSGLVAPGDADGFAEQPVRPANYDAIRRRILNRDNLRLQSPADARAELAEYASAGGRTLVDSTSLGFGRDPVGLARLSRESGVNVVMGSGYYVHALHPPSVPGARVADLAAEIVADLTEGVGDTGVPAGLVGEIGLSWPPHPDELKVLEAACQAQRATGAALQLHPGRSPDAPLAAVAATTGFGVDPTRVIMSHVDRTLWSREQLLELAATGCYVELDLFGQESSYYAFNPDARRPNDRTRLEWLAMLAEAGHAGQLLMSQDICQKVYLRRYGGPGYTHILESVLPLMRRMGWTEEQIARLTRANPATALAITEAQ